MGADTQVTAQACPAGASHPGAPTGRTPGPTEVVAAQRLAEGWGGGEGSREEEPLSTPTPGQALCLALDREEETLDRVRVAWVLTSHTSPSLAPNPLWVPSLTRCF